MTTSIALPHAAEADPATSSPTAWILIHHRPRVEGGMIPVMVYLDEEVATYALAVKEATSRDPHSIVIVPLCEEF